MENKDSRKQDDIGTHNNIVKSIENLNLYAQNKCPLRKSKSMDNMLSCGGNCLTKHTEGDNTVMMTNSNDQIGIGENISHYTTNQLSNMLSPLQTHQSQYSQFPQVHISQQQQPNIPPNSHMMTVCYANNENCCLCTRHCDLSSLPFTSPLQYTEIIKNIHEDFKNQGYMLCSHRCCSTQKPPNQRTASSASPSLALSSDYYAHSMSDPASAGPTASIQHPPIPYQQTANVTNVPTTYPSTFITTPSASSSSVGRPFPQVPPRANFTANPTVPSGPNVDVHMHSVSFGNVSISQSSNFGRHAPQVPPHQSTPPTNIAASPLVNVPVHPSSPNTVLASLFNYERYYIEPSPPFHQPHALQTQFTPQISYPFEPTPSRSASLNSVQNQNSAAIDSAISQFTFNPNNFALNQANTSNTDLNQKYHMMQRQPFSSGSISNNFPSTSSNLTSSHDSIATHIDTSDNQTTSPSDIPIGGNNTTSRKRPNTNSNNRFFETERIKKDKSEIVKYNRETTRRLQINILEKCNENNKKSENVEKKVDNLSQDIRNVERKADNLSQDIGNVKILMQNFSQLSQDIGIVKNLVQNLSQLYSSHARGNAYSCSSQSIPSNSNSTPNHNTVHVNQSGTASWLHMDQFHQQESIIRDNSSGCSSENDIGSLNIRNE